MKFIYVAALMVLTSQAFGQGVLKGSDVKKEANIVALINSAASKCADGSVKQVLDMGSLSSLHIEEHYVAKSNNQDFITITKKNFSNAVTLYYCAPKRIIWENGTSRTEIVPMERFSFNLGVLNKRPNCDFSDIVSGYVELKFKGISMPQRIIMRPIMGNAQEQAEYKKLCSEKVRESSGIVPDGDPTKPGYGSNQ